MGAAAGVSGEGEIRIAPIGYFRGGGKYRYEAPRQGTFAGESGRIELNAGQNFETALRNLEGFERIWVLFVFDRNGEGWRPTTRPPVTAPGLNRVGTFASRSPYRPNPIGLSCVKLERVEGRTLEVSGTDLLDGTPVIDIKPYIPGADAFPEAKAGWVDGQDADPWRVEAGEGFLRAAGAVLEAGGPDLLKTARLQLGSNPADGRRKRVWIGEDGRGTFAVRMFRLKFRARAAEKLVELDGIESGYTEEEMLAAEDPYNDKEIHRAVFGRGEAAGPGKENE